MLLTQEAPAAPVAYKVTEVRGNSPQVKACTAQGQDPGPDPGPRQDPGQDAGQDPGQDPA